jgi:uncharacterized protein DUF5996
VISVTSSQPDAWPALPLGPWASTRSTLHRWLQIVGKTRLVQTPWVNHSWHATLYVTARGLTTSSIPYEDRTFQIDFDFIDHRLEIASSDGAVGGFPLGQQSVAAFYRQLMEELIRLRLPLAIHMRPNEVKDTTRFDQDESHATYDPEWANRFWRVLVQADRVLQAFRVRFVGKCSPVHFFWGIPDLAVTRFSGRIAPVHPGGVLGLPDAVTREAYSHEVSSCGFWTGDRNSEAAFYSYTYPEPLGFAATRVQPAEASYSARLGWFLLPYEAVRLSENPDAVLLDFLQSTYEAAATLGRWDREALERRSMEPSWRP